MDKLNRYREIIKAVLTEIARFPFSFGELEHKTIFDPQNDNYAVLILGWEQKKREHYSLVHVEIINGKIWIQEDNTESGIAAELEAAGIPKSDIVLGFQHPSVRPYTEYAAV